VNDLPNSLRRFVGFKAILEKRYVTDYLLEVLSIDFELDWRAVKNPGELNMASEYNEHLQIFHVVADLFIAVVASSFNGFWGTGCPNGHDEIKVDVWVRNATQPSGLFFYFHGLLGS